MSKRNWLLAGFAVVVAAQLAVPGWLIIGRELTLRQGEYFKFRTRPVDPADAFRGRYVWLGLEPESVPVPATWSNDRYNHGYYNQKAYAVLTRDTNGYAIVSRLERDWPAGETAVQVQTSWIDTHNRTNGLAHIQWPGLDRYYMAESKAPAAEVAYWQHNRRNTNQTCHVTVRVRGRQAVIENLYLDDQPIQEWLRTHPKP